MSIHGTKMAIWNYRAELIPKEWIETSYGGIPSTLDREETIEQALQRDPDFLTRERASSRWEGISCPEDFVKAAGAILDISKQTQEFVCCGSDGSHRIELWLVDGRPDIVEIKLDLRHPALALFEDIVAYAGYLGTYIVPDDRYTVVPPTMEALLSDLMDSRAYKFCSDPQGCVREIAAGYKAQR